MLCSIKATSVVSLSCVVEFAYWSCKQKLNMLSLYTVLNYTEYTECNHNQIGSKGGYAWVDLLVVGWGGGGEA